MLCLVIRLDQLRKSVAVHLRHLYIGDDTGDLLIQLTAVKTFVNIVPCCQTVLGSLLVNIPGFGKCIADELIEQM